MSKRLFEVLDIMNQNDEKNGSATVGVNVAFVAAQKVKQGGHVTMGVPESVIMDLVLKNNVVPILIIVDKDEYERITDG